MSSLWLEFWWAEDTTLVLTIQPQIGSHQLVVLTNKIVGLFHNSASSYLWKRNLWREIVISYSKCLCNVRSRRMQRETLCDFSPYVTVAPSALVASRLRRLAHGFASPLSAGQVASGRDGDLDASALANNLGLGFFFSRGQRSGGWRHCIFELDFRAPILLESIRCDVADGVSMDIHGISFGRRG